MENLQKLKNLWLIALIAAIVFVTFLPVLDGEFAKWADDENYLTNCRYRGLLLSHLHWMFTTFHLGHYQPLAWMTLGLDFLLWEMKPSGYHLTSLLLHVLNAILFYFLIAAFLRRTHTFAPYVNTTGFRVCCAAGALFFGLHPLRVESVAWLSARGDLVCTAFWLSSLIAYLRIHEGKSDIHRKKWFVVSLILFCFSLLSRAWAMTLPVVLLILDVYPLHRHSCERSQQATWAGLLMEKIPFAVLTAGTASLAVVGRRAGMSICAIEKHGVVARCMQAAYGLCFYVWKTVVPVHLSPLYLLDRYAGPAEPKYVLSALIVLGVAVLLITGRHRWPWTTAACLCYAVIVSPVLGFTQSGWQITADRYTYLSCLPFAVLVGTGLARLWLARQKNRFASKVWSPVVSVTLVVLLVFSVLSFRQARIWRDSRSLWGHVLKLDPANHVAHLSLGAVCQQEGDLTGAINHFNTAIRLYPDNANAYNDRGALHHTRGNLASALSDFNFAIWLDPAFANAYNNRGAIREKRGDLTAALADYNKSIQLRPFVYAYVNRGTLRHKQGNLAGALEDYNRAIEFEPIFPTVYVNRGIIRQTQNHLRGAIEDFCKALEIAPPDWPSRQQTEQMLSNARQRMR